MIISGEIRAPSLHARHYRRLAFRCRRLLPCPRRRTLRHPLGLGEAFQKSYNRGRGICRHFFFEDCTVLHFFEPVKLIIEGCELIEDKDNDDEDQGNGNANPEPAAVAPRFRSTGRIDLAHIRRYIRRYIPHPLQQRGFGLLPYFFWLSAETSPAAGSRVCGRAL